MKKIVVFTGAGISAESGIPTFRDRGGLWDQYDPKKVATGTAMKKNPNAVIEFMNMCQTQMRACEPNEAHKALARLEEKFDVTVITQNIDTLHEEGGSTNVLHLHGNINEKRSSDSSLIVEKLEGEIEIGDLCEDGSQWRHNVVLFEENLPILEMEKARDAMSKADLLIVVGTTLEVFPAAGLLQHFNRDNIMYIVDPGKVNLAPIPGRKFVVEPATKGVPFVVDLLIKEETVGRSNP